MTDNELKFYAYNGYANWLETGNMSLSAENAQRQMKPFNALNSNQMRMVLRLRKMAEATLHERLAR